MSETKRTVPTLIFNVLFAIVCAAAIVMYFISPVWRIDLKANISNEMMHELTGGEIDDLNEALGEDGTDVSLSIALDSMAVAQCLVQWDAAAMVDDILDRNLDSLATQLVAVIEPIAKNTIKTQASSAVKTEIKNAVKDYLSSPENEVTEERVNELLTEAGVTDTYIEEKTDAIIDRLYTNGSSVDGVVDEVMTTVDEVYADLTASNVEEFQDIALTEESRESIRNAVADIVTDYADENGYINPEEIVNQLVIEALQSMSGESSEEEGAGTAALTAASYALASEAQQPADPSAQQPAGSSDSNEQLKTELKNYLSEQLLEGPAAPAVFLPFVMLGLGILLAISLLSWVYLLLKILFKTFMKNKYVKVKMPIILGWFLFLFLMLLPNLALTYIPTMLAGVLPAEVLSVFTMLTGTAFFSSAVYAAIAAAALIVLWIPYRIICKPKNN
ncbi:MAG TPA: hypothetical protein H9812_05805 [Candidatus Gallimonas intestinigallinarum]|uniref:Uncharacterized protein n=1 Tax=Candidatus Gallimonas intestinigallinarum TaxID=2838604 RepID=A0A9D2DXQ6_9FIRM|nr:hypothetical protein [Candidatus Gallimonas intestinigallinarum]